jgi:hypothetical protein
MNFLTSPFATLFGKVGNSSPSKPAATVPGLQEGSVFSPQVFSMYQDVGNLRGLGDVNDVIKQMHRYDPDAAQSLWAVLRFASTPLDIVFRDEKGVYDADKTRDFKTMLKANWLISTYDVSAEELSDMIMRELFLYGAVGCEVVLNEAKFPVNFILAKNKDIKWRREKGKYIPFQPKQGGGETKLNIPTFFFQSLDREADAPVGESPLLPAIQAITFKQAVIADIQRVIKRTGYPRLKVTVMEDILRKNAPIEVRSDPQLLGEWLGKQKSDIASGLQRLKPEDAVVIFDSLEIDTLENSNAGSVDFRPIMEILNGQVVSALKSLPSILGKTASGGSQNIASVEAMVFLNTPRFLQDRSAKLLSQVYTMSARLMGMNGYIEVKHKPINLRPELELEPQMVARQSRILQLQSFGHIDDSEAALALGIEHLPSEALSGTQFLTGGPSVNTGSISPNSDPLGRSITGGSGAGDTTGTPAASRSTRTTPKTKG